jgi:cation:H+ antiporter
MVWFAFLLSTVVIVYAATQLAKYGDVIAVRTRLGGMFIGVILLAGATSLPELLTSINSLRAGAPNLAAGNLIGSNSFNMMLLAVIDLIQRDQRILRKAALKHALSGSLATFLAGLVVFFILADLDVKFGWVGLDSLLIIAVYIGGVRLLQTNSDNSTVLAEIPIGTLPLWQGLAGFGLAALALVFTTPILVRSSVAISEITGLGTTFIGTTLVAAVTSLPELVTTIAALKLGADDMAIGNLFGSNMFNMFAIGLTDFFYTNGSFLAGIDPAFVLVGMLGLLMTGLGLIGNLARLDRRIWFIELDALLLFVLYFSGMYLLYTRGVSP